MRLGNKRLEIEDLVLTVEQAMHLQELGLDMNNAVFMWTRIMPEYENENTPQRDKAWSVRRLCYTEPEYPYFDVIPTYTLQEILDNIPKVQYSFGGKPLEITYGNIDMDADYCIEHELTYFNLTEHGTTSLQGAYKMMEWVLKNLRSGFFKKVDKA